MQALDLTNDRMVGRLGADKEIKVQWPRPRRSRRIEPPAIVAALLDTNFEIGPLLLTPAERKQRSIGQAARNVEVEHQAEMLGAVFRTEVAVLAVDRQIGDQCDTGAPV